MIHRDHKRVQGFRFYIDPDIATHARISEPPFHRFSDADTIVRTSAIKGLTMVEIDMAATGTFPACDPFNQRPAA
jgi:hypothetical protein